MLFIGVVLMRLMGLLLVFCCCIVLPARAQDDIRVARAAFAGGVADRAPGPALLMGQRAAPGPLWFWTELTVSKAALADLRRRNLLPLQHRWYRSIAGLPRADERPDFFRNLEEPFWFAGLRIH